MPEVKNHTPISQKPAEILQRLIQFDTTNPPGNTSDCVSFIKGLLSTAGIENKIFTKKPEYPTLYARIPEEERHLHCCFTGTLM